MKRSKKHRVKEEPESSTSRSATEKEHDLAYYIHDRVELMHQVFSVLKPKELKAMAPECVRHISINDLQELCMEELLGISSKRLCAILDGATPPSDTESSSESEQLEMISLESISSDEEILAQVSSKKSKKHKHRSKSKPKKRKSKDKDDENRDQADRSRRAGLTVLELLELQARARAIRAQLQQEQASVVSTGGPSESVTGNSSDDEVEIKEEAAEVVEISSEDEKPNIQVLEERIAVTRKETAADTTNPKSVTKRVNDLVITVPKTSTSRKIKLKRTVSKPTENSSEVQKSSSKTRDVIVEVGVNDKNQGSASKQVDSSKSDINATNPKATSKTDRTKVDLVSAKDKKKKRKRGKRNNKDGSDHDEISLQLSDTEKMDLLEDLEGKKSEKCSDTEDSTSDSSDEDSVKDDSDDDKNTKPNDSDSCKTDLGKDIVDLDKINESERNSESVRGEKKNSNNTKTNEEGPFTNKTQSELEDVTETVDTQIVEKVTYSDKSDEINMCDVDNSKQISNDESMSQPTESKEKKNGVSNQNAVEINKMHDTIERSDEDLEDVEITQDENMINSEGSNNKKTIKEVSKDINVVGKESEHTNCPEPSGSNKELTVKVSNLDVNNKKKDQKEKSDGELSDRDSSEVEASDFKPDIVCISDDEETRGKKKKKKDKKSKKEKKSKKKKNFRESADQNFYSETNKSGSNQSARSGKEVILISEETNDLSSEYNSVITENMDDSQSKDTISVGDTNTHDLKENDVKEIESLGIRNTNIDLDDDVYEILELSDNSSCYEVEEISISKEPTAEEIEALSAKLDELDTVSVIDPESHGSKEYEEIDNVSWKDRYLNSSKVKKVLTTANLMNAMRKKNLELKIKLQASKKETEKEKNEVLNVAVTTNLEDGSIEQYETLETSTKYVDPVKEPGNTDNAIEIDNGLKMTGDNNETDSNAKSKKDKVSKEMKKDAKQLLKMYKMLLKYNDMSKKDLSKKKKKKKKSKDKDKEKNNSSQVATCS